MLNLSMLLEESARLRPDKVAFRLGESDLTYRELDQAACSVAAKLLDLGLASGDKVALSCPNLPAFPIIYFGILKAGGAVVPLNILLKRDEIAYHLADSEAVAYFCFEGSDELPIGTEGGAGFRATPGCRHLISINASGGAKPTIEGAGATFASFLESPASDFQTTATAADDTAVILYTSGTTGRPKGAELSHSNLWMNVSVCRDMLRGSESDISLVTLPLFHSFGQVVQMNLGIFCGMTSILLPRFDPAAALSIMEREEITFFCGVPTMYWALLHSPDTDQFDLEKISNNLRLCVSGGASLPVQVLRDFEAKFEVPILEGYGLSETSPVACFNQLEQDRKAGSIGTPVWGVKMRLIDGDGGEVATGEPGEIIIRGHNVMKGYYRRPEANAESIRDGWFRTGDVATVDEDGFYYIVDRTKDMILRGGFNVYPREIEEVLLTHPAVSLAAVIGVPDAEHGEEVKAFVVLKEEVKISAEELLAFGREKMAAYKYPRHIEFRASLPMTATGKILKKELRAEAVPPGEPS